MDVMSETHAGREFTRFIKYPCALAIIAVAYGIAQWITTGSVSARRILISASVYGVILLLVGGVSKRIGRVAWSSIVVVCVLIVGVALVMYVAAVPGLGSRWQWILAAVGCGVILISQICDIVTARGGGAK